MAADEALRVCRPGRPHRCVELDAEGFVGDLFGILKAYAPAPPPGTLPPLLWGDPAHVCALLGDAVTDVAVERRVLTVRRFADPAAWRAFFTDVYGPLVAVYRTLDGEWAAALDRDLEALAARYDRGTGTTVMDWEYLLLTACRTGPRGAGH